MDSCNCEPLENFEPCTHQRKSINKFKKQITKNKKIKINAEKGWIHSENGWTNWYAITGLPEDLKIKIIITEDNQIFEIEK